MRTWVPYAAGLLALLCGCKKPEQAQKTNSLAQVNSELISLRKNRTVTSDAGPVSTLVQEREVEPSDPAQSVWLIDSDITTQTDATAPKQAKKKRVRLPAPLRPQKMGTAPESDAPQPCTIVVSRICSILTEGAEECAEARNALAQAENVDAQTRCANALAWYERRFSDERRTKPCALLADVVCRQAGQNSVQCKRAKEDIRLLRKTIQHACKAAILMTLALR